MLPLKSAHKLMDNAKEFVPDDIPRLLIGNKIDLDKRQVDYDEGKSLAEKLGMRFCEVRVKENLNVGVALNGFIKEVKDKIQRQE